MEPLPDLATLKDDDLEEVLRRLKDEEEAISLRRRVLHGQIDLLRAERNARLRDMVAAEGKAEGPDASVVAATVVGADEQPVSELELELHEEIEPLPDLSTLTTEELRVLIRELDREEDRVSLERRLLHGRIDILSAERLLREHAAAEPEPSHVDVDRLKEILAKRLLSRRGDEQA